VFGANFRVHFPRDRCESPTISPYAPLPHTRRDVYGVPAVVGDGTIVGPPEEDKERLQPVIDARIDYFIVTIPR
jgi:hypothetical protein